MIDQYGHETGGGGQRDDNIPYKLVIGSIAVAVVVSRRPRCVHRVSVRRHSGLTSVQWPR